MTDEVASIDWPTTYISIVPRVSGIVSVISSSIIIFVIFRSASKLSTVYHQIMFAMSIFDIIGSIGMALTSLPMPKEMPQEKELGISWPGVRYGNTFTCNLQGFSINLGSITMMTFNVSLCVYYACAIHFRLSEKTIRKYVKPIILVAPIIFGLLAAVPPLFLDLFNPPTSMASAWCMPIPYPDYEFASISNGNDDSLTLTLRGKKSDQTKYLFCMLFAIASCFVLIVVSLGLVIGTVCYLPNKQTTLRIATGSASSLPNSIICSDLDVNSENIVNLSAASLASRPLALEGPHFKGKKLRDDSQRAPNEDVYYEVGQSFQVNDGIITKHTKSPIINNPIPPTSESNEMLHTSNNSRSVKSENASFVKRKKLQDGSLSVTKEDVYHERRRSFQCNGDADNSTKISITSFPVPQKSVNVEEFLHIPAKSIGTKSEIVSFAVLEEECKEDSSILDSSGHNISMSDSTLEEQQMIARMNMNPGVLALQALAYIAGYGVCTLLLFQFDPFDDGASTRFKMAIALIPLQGFLNMLIFLSHKVYNYRRLHRETTILQVLQLLFTTSVQEPFFVERMTIVHDHQAERILNGAFRFSTELGDRLLLLRRSHSHRSPSVDEVEVSEDSSDVISSTYNRKRDDSDGESGVFKTLSGYYLSKEVRKLQAEREILAGSVSFSDLDLSGFSSVLSSGGHGHFE